MLLPHMPCGHPPWSRGHPPWSHGAPAAEPEGIQKESSALDPATVLVLAGACSPLLTAVALLFPHAVEGTVPVLPPVPPKKCKSVQFSLPRCKRKQSGFKLF